MHLQCFLLTECLVPRSDSWALLSRRRFSQFLQPVLRLPLLEEGGQCRAQLGQCNLSLFPHGCTIQHLQADGFTDICNLGRLLQCGETYLFFLPLQLNNSRIAGWGAIRKLVIFVRSGMKKVPTSVSSTFSLFLHVFLASLCCCLWRALEVWQPSWSFTWFWKAFPGTRISGYVFPTCLSLLIPELHFL